MKVVMRRSARSGRAALRSQGRPSGAGRNEQTRFWPAIAAGLSSEDAALEAALSHPVGSRYPERRAACHQRCSDLRQNRSPGGTLSLVEREEIALLKGQGHSTQEIGRSLGRAAATVSCEPRRNAATRAGGWSIGQQLPNGMRIDPPAGPSRPSLRSMQPCALMWSRDLLAAS